MTRSESGISSSSSAEVETITLGVGNAKAGIRDGRDPLARMQWSNVTVWLPSAPETSSDPDALKRAVP